MDSYGFIWWLLFILWSLVVSHTVAFPCFFFFPDQVVEVLPVTSNAWAPSVVLRVFLTWDEGRFSSMETIDFRCWNQILKFTNIIWHAYFCLLRVIFPKISLQDLAEKPGRFGPSLSSRSSALLHLPEAATVAADFGERVLRCSDGIRVKTRVAMYGILLHPD